MSFIQPERSAAELAGPPPPDVAQRAREAAERLPTVGNWPGAVPYVPLCDCSCHDCCVPQDAACDDCADQHGQPERGNR